MGNVLHTISNYDLLWKIYNIKKNIKKKTMIKKTSILDWHMNQLLFHCTLNMLIRNMYIYIWLMFISRFSLRDKVTLRLLKLHFYGPDVVEWSRALDIRLSNWCCSVSMVWVQISSREEQKFDSSKNLILTLFGLIFRRIYIYIVTVRIRLD